MPCKGLIYEYETLPIGRWHSTQQWMLGFVSALNKENDRDFGKNKKGLNLYYHVLSHCRENIHDTIMHGVQAVYDNYYE